MNIAVSRYVVLLLAAASLPWVPNASAQESYRIAGVVLDENQEPLPGVNVLLVDAKIGAVSDAYGRFAIDGVPEGSHVLRCSFLGYEPDTLDLVVPTERPIVCRLMPHIYDAGEVVVTASRRPQLASDVPASIAVLGADFISARRIESLDTAIRHVSGVSVQGNQVSIRGSSGFAYNTGSRVLLLVDGMPLLSPDTDGVPFEAFPMSRVKQVEILKGPGSALYGSGALGGVVNIISESAGDKPATSIRAAVGFNEPFRYPEWTRKWTSARDFRPDYTMEITHERSFGANASGWMSISGIVDPGYLNQDRSRSINIFAKASAGSARRTRLDVLAGLLIRRRENFLFWNGLSDALNPGSIAISRVDEPTGASDNHTMTVSLLPQLRMPTKRGVVNVRARFYSLLIRPIDDDGRLKPLAQGTVGFRTGAEAQFSGELADGQVTTGANVDLNLTTSSFFRTESGESVGRQPEMAAYVQYERDIAQMISAVGGLRLDVFQVSSIETIVHLSPKLAIARRVGPAISARASAGAGFRVPSVAERYTDDQGYFPVFRNLDLRPETSINAELGVRYEPPKAMASVDLALFYSRLDDLIEPRFVQLEDEVGSRRLGFQFVNLSRGRVAGLEVESRAALLCCFRARLGYTLLSSMDFDTRRPLAYRPQHLLVGGIALDRNSVTAGLDARAASKPATVDSDFSRFVPDADIAVNSIVLDGRVGWSRKNLRVSLQVENLLNYYYLERAALLAPPRHFGIQVNSTF